MSTIGHPLSDVSNLMSPYSFAVDPPNQAMQSHCNPAFIPPTRLQGLPVKEQCLDWYAQITGWDPAGDLAWGDIFATFRNGIIMQGIAARYAQRQASSEKAEEYAKMMVPNGQFSWGLVQRWLERHKKINEVPKL